MLRAGRANALRANVPARILSLRRLLLCAAAFAVGVVRAEAQGVPLEIRGEGAFPLQYVATNNTTRQHNTLYGPYFGLAAIAHPQPGLTTSVFADVGNSLLGQFRENDNTFASYGANIVRRWGGFSAGASLEHTYFYDGTFSSVRSTANDINVFARYNWRPNADLRITPSVMSTARVENDFAIERYSYSARVEIEQRLAGAWWFIARPRVRYSDYVGREAGRRDTSLSMVAGLRYAFNDNLAFTTLAGVEERSSTAPGRSFERFVVGASIDLSFDFLRTR